ncbi:MAG TPA: D-Ala-D-Ala carboxypeptidase family metallohydrolase [Gemmatimonadaceae bacterium]|nr:D-Ala-D-Ala carboxypeptidase family metallohydrolase [Gemmatimonadaceae bacterium]
MTGHLLPPDRQDEQWSFRHAALSGVVAVVVIGVLVVFPPQRLLGSVFGVSDPPPVAARPEAFGASGDVRLQLKLPGQTFALPLSLADASRAATYQWVSAVDSGALAPPGAFHGDSVQAPLRPGFYHMAVTSEGRRAIVNDVVLAVMVPFNEKIGASLNGYRIGTYRAERARGEVSRPPPGFVEVWEEDADLWLSNHLQVADFITHDDQMQWPRYVALDPRILDKVELVLDHLGARHRVMTVDVHSGFRTPLHNRRVPRAASDSRHQYGDAVDLAVDADGDGRVSYFDILAIARAVDMVEAEHPDLVGGMGVYGNHGNNPYVHIDVRGERKRWRG